MPDSVDIKFRATGPQDFLAGRRNLMEEVVRGIIDGVNAIIAGRIRSNLSGSVLQKRSGKLFDTVKVNNASVSGDTIHGSVQAGGPEAPYGIYFENGGTSYYTITPVSAKVLRFMSAGKEIYAARVNHPPTPKLPWFAVETAPGAKMMREALEAGMEEVMKQ